MFSIFTFQAGVLNKYLKTVRNFSAWILTVFSLLFIANINANAQLSITSTDTPFTIDFDNTVSGVNNGQFTGSGFTTSPGTGQLNSNAFSVLGLSDGDLLFGGTGTTGDYARGDTTGGVTTGGIYAFTVATGNNILGFQPSDADMTPGEIILKITNNSGVSASSIKVEYNIWELNNSTGPRSTSLTFSYSPDNSTYTPVPSVDFTTGDAADFPPQWKSPSSTHLKVFIIDLTGSELNNGSSFYLKFSTNDNAGTTGDRDELGIDDIKITINPTNDSDSEATVYSTYQEPSGLISSLANNSSTRRIVFYFQISDTGSSDGLPTNVETVRFVPNTTNESWSTQIQGAILSDGTNNYTPQTVDITDTYMDLTFSEGTLSVGNGQTLPLRLEIYLNLTGIVDGGNLDFKITSSSHGFTAYPSGSSFTTTFPSDITSNQFTIDVSATELRFVTQPINTNTYEAMAADVSVEATDANGNRDLDFIDAVDLSSSGTMTGDPISVTASSGLATWLQSTDSIVHTVGGTGLTLTASSGTLTSVVSNTFDIIQTADRLAFTSQPTVGQMNKVVGQITVSALKPDLSVDTTFAKNITISKDSGPGNVSGTLTKAAVNGVAVFDDIQFDLAGDYTLLASSESYMTTAISDTINIRQFYEDFASCPPAGWLSVLISGNSWSCGSGYASVSGIGASSPTEAWYIMPSIDFSTMSNQVLSFDSWTSGTDTNHPRLEVMYSTDYTGSGNPNVATWTSLVFSPPVENSATWAPSGLINLSGVTTPAYIAFKYTSSGTASGSATEWRIDNVLITEDGCTAPAVQATNLTFTGIQATQMTLNWNNGDGTGRLVVAKQGSAPAEIPADGTNYAANAAYGTAGTEIGTSFVVYKGNGNTVTVTNLTQDSTYHFAVYEYNCDATSPTFNTTNPAIGSQATNASDIIADASFTYSELNDYGNYAGINGLTPTNSKAVFGLTVRDGGATNATDGLSTTLTSITFSTNGSGAIRAAALFDSGNNNIAEKTVNGTTEFTLDNFTHVVADGTNSNIVLRVTFEDGVTDNEQVVFTVTAATADPAGTVFFAPDAGGAQSSTTSPDNTLRVTASSLAFVRVPTSTIPVDMAFTIEVEAIDSRNSRDLDKSLTISKLLGSGNLSTAGFTQTTGLGTALWNDLQYDVEEDIVQFRITDGVSLILDTDTLRSRRAFTEFSFTGANGDETTYPPDYQPVNVTINNISRGTGITATVLSDAFNARNWPDSVTGFQGDSYYEVIITANYGYSFNLTGIELDHRKSASGPPDWEVRSSINNFSSNLGGFQQTIGDGIWNRNTYLDFGTTIQGVTSDTIRIYAYNSTSGLGTWGIDNLRIYGVASDIQAPSFVTGYPKFDSVAVNGFDLVVNLDQAGTAYYVVQDTALVAPTQSQVLAGQDGSGNPAVAADTIGVQVDSTDVYERVRGLASATVYDVYYVLDDGVNQSTVFQQSDVPTADIDVDFVAATQPGGNTIPSTSDNSADSVAVFSFSISDAGTNDGAPTHVRKLRITKGANNTVADWSTVIGGVRVYNNTESTIVNPGSVTIYADSIVLTGSMGTLTIADGASVQLTLFVWLTSSVTDNDSLQFAIGGTASGNETDEIGSQFQSTLTTLTSNTFSIDVSAIALNIISHTLSITDKNQDISLEVEAVDANGNRDLDETSDVTIVLGQGSGTISANSGLTHALNNGDTLWSDIRYDTDSSFITLITSSTTLVNDTTGLIEIGQPSDLIVTTTTTLTTHRSVNNVIIQSTGNLTIAPGVVLSVSADYTIDGVMNGQSGTVDFVGNVLQTIKGAVTSADFYNITVSNTSTSGVVAEININLHNTLSMAPSTIFDADGAANDKVFTLISTPTYTARIATIGDGATFNGNITWQRSLRTGPEGWRYIGTPILGQTLGNISDDVWIQGISENYPSAWTNIANYSEPLGTTGQNGLDGWVDFTSNTDNFNVGEGKKLWLWNFDYGLGEQVIINTGAPVIGDGADNIAGAGEAYSFPLSFTSTSLDGGGWNFLANPYPSEIDWESAGFTRSNIEGDAVYIWNPNLQNYGTYNSTGGSVNGVTQYIASGQAFFVKAIDVSASITVGESAKSSNDGNSFLREADEPMISLKMRITSDKNHIDETVVAFKPYATDGYDPHYDARKLAGGWVNLSSKVGEERLMAINTMGAFRGIKKVEMEIEPYYFGKYSFTFPEIRDMDPETIIKLRDNYLNKEQVISPTSVYNFTIEENVPETYQGRFSLEVLAPVKFRYDEVIAKAGKEFVVPVFADQLADVISATMIMGWDLNAVEFLNVEDENPALPGQFDLSDIDKGILRFNNAGTLPVELSDGTRLFSIRFRAIPGQSQVQLRFEKELMHVTAINDIDMPINTKDIVLDILQNKNILGNVAAYDGKPVDGVKVSIEGDDVSEYITDQLGAYKLDAYERSNYVITADMNVPEGPAGAVTTSDILMVKRHILLDQTLASPYQIVAADVNGSKSVTALDMAEMRKIVLGIDDSFSSGLDWLFIPEVYDLTNDPFAFDTKAEISLNDQDVNFDFVGVKVGDVDNSWADQSGSRNAVGELMVSLENVMIEGDFIEIPVRAYNFTDISGYQFTVSWDASQMELYDYDNEAIDGHFNDQFMQQGILTTMWDDLNGKSIDLEDGAILFVLRFRGTDDKAVSDVSVGSELTKAAAFDGQLRSVTIKSIPAHVDLNELANGRLELYQNVPNPVDYATQFEFRIAKAGDATFTIVNVLGEVIYRHEQYYKPGVYSLSWDLGQGTRTLKSGVYLYRLESNGEVAVKKMIIK